MEKPGVEEMGLGPGVVPPGPALAPEPHCLWAAHCLPPWALASPSVTRGLGCLDDCLVAVLGVPLLSPCCLSWAHLCHQVGATQVAESLNSLIQSCSTCACFVSVCIYS